MEPLNKGHLGTQAAVPYSEVVPYWEVCIKLCFYSIIDVFGAIPKSLALNRWIYMCVAQVIPPSLLPVGIVQCGQCSERRLGACLLCLPEGEPHCIVHGLLNLFVGAKCY